MKPRALIFWGGSLGHKPEELATIFAEELTRHGFDVRVDATMECLDDVEALKQYTLIIPCWTAGELSPARTAALVDTVREHGVGLAGIHGAGDAFRANGIYQWALGGRFVDHPNRGDYTVRATDPYHPIMKGFPGSFTHSGAVSEPYYMLVDPAVHVLADMVDYRFDDRVFHMPVAWVKMWGKGRVFYSSLGHDAALEFREYPAVFHMTINGLLWAANKL